ncbi:hypothetical protein M9H77_17062 [Catharanthus roseus]|uniref:Uncharacterized protein n=1 Tax=Catharanthus roseus TaxID=4058 RepID=A0ACC0B3K1_CATRO|nr:hypothetical protein M9H77_17062 [Catharanthus roseus]
MSRSVKICKRRSNKELIMVPSLTFTMGSNSPMLRSKNNYEHILNDSPWVVLGHNLTVGKWKPNFCPSQDKISETLVWVRFPEISIEFFHENFLLRMGDLVGRTVKRSCIEILPMSEISPAPPSQDSFCTHCKKTGHELTNCFQLVGYPHWWPKQVNFDGRGSQPGRGGRGQPARGRHGRLCGWPLFGRMDAGNSPGGRRPDAWPTQRASGVEEKVVAAMSLLEKKNTASSGRSHHMTGRKDFLSNLNNVYPYSIGQPNGAKAVALEEGTVSLTPRL